MAALSIESIEQGTTAHHSPKGDQYDGDINGIAHNTKSSTATGATNWLLLAVNIACLAVGTIGGPLLSRLYFRHGGRRKWIPSWLQTAGFPILLLPISVLYFLHRRRGTAQREKSCFLAEPKLLLAGSVVGVFIGLDNFLYSEGLSFLPVSTSSLLYSTQLAFTAFFAFIVVRQRFTPYSVNAVVLMTLGSIILGIRKSGDRPPGVSNMQYLLGFLLTIASAALLGFLLPCIELTYSKASRAVTYAVVLQFQFVVSFFATVFCSVGMLANKDFSVIPREARAYAVGETKYYVVLAASAVLWQLVFMGSIGLIFVMSSLFAGVVNASILPFTEIAAVIFYKEKFTGEKGMSMALCLWGFVSYFYGMYKIQNKDRSEEPPSGNLN